MGRATWFEADGTKRGEWTEEEDQRLVAYIDQYGIGDWRFLPEKAGLQRCGKSCRLRWFNYLRPGIKKGKFTPQEEEEIIKLHAILGNRWAVIAQQMPSRSDSDIKNHWNSCLKKRLRRNGIDPMTHQPIVNNLTVKTPSRNSECCGSSSSTASPSSSSSSGSARLLNKIATGISSRQHGVDRIKNILSDPRMITSINGNQEEELRKDQEDDFLMWDEAEMSRFMEETGVTEYQTTSYYDGVYNSCLDFSSSPYGVYETDQLVDYLFR